MPYISKENRAVVDSSIQEMNSVLALNGSKKGDLNYTIFNLVSVDIKSISFGIYQYGGCTLISYSIGSRNHGKSGHDYFVTLTYTQAR